MAKKRGKTKGGNEFCVSTLTAVQRFYGVSWPTIKEWRNQGMPVRDDRLYDLREIFRWWIDSEKFKRTTGCSIQPGNSLEEEKLRIEVETKRLKLQNEARELVKRQNAYATIENMFHRVRTRLESIPEELSSSLPPETRAAYIDDAKQKIRLILREMEHWSIEE